MKKTHLLLSCTAAALLLASCSQPAVKNEKPTLEKIKEIAELNTLTSFYHNVAKKTKEPGGGFWNIGKTEREYWVEYTGKARIGVDFKNIELEENGTDLTVTIPGARVLNVGIVSDTYSPDSIFSSKDNFWNSNKITVEDQKDAIKKGQDAMELAIWQNSSLLCNAQYRARDLIEAYIESIGQAAGVNYNISFQLEENTIPPEIQERIDAAAQEEN